MRSSRLAAMALAVALVLLGSLVAQAQQALSLLIDGVRITPDVPPVILNGRTLVPIRFIAEGMGMAVGWDGATQTVTLRTQEITVVMQVGHPTAYVGSRAVTLDVPPRIMQGRTMVPLRFVAEATGARVDFEAATLTVRITSGGASAPGTPGPPGEPPPPPPSEPPPPPPGQEPPGGAAIPALGPSLDLSRVAMGSSTTAVQAAWGEPVRREPGFYGIEWWRWQPDPARYLTAGFRDGRLVALYALGNGWSYRGISRQHTPQQALEQLGLGRDNTLNWDGQRWRFDCSQGALSDYGQLPLVVADGHVGIIYPDWAEQRVAAMLVMDPATFMASAPASRMSGCTLWYARRPPTPVELIGAARTAAEGSEARLLLDLTNVERALRGLPPLAWSDLAADAALGHSRDMAEQNFFSHTSPTTGSPGDRLRRAGLPDRCGYGENIAAGYVDGLAVHHGWMNSPGHRKNLLNPHFDQMGVGVYERQYTENMIDC